MKRILIVAVHPDDETLGCGGTLLRFKEEGASIHWLLVTSIYANSEKGALTINSFDRKFFWRHDRIHPIVYPMHRVEERAREIRRVRDAYSFDSIHELCLPTICLDQFPMAEIIDNITRVINEIKPDTIILPFKGDIHSDHRIVFRAAYSCTKTFRNPFLRRIMMMETTSETDFAVNIREDIFSPNLFVNITKYLNRKIEIMSLYGSELASPPFPRSVDNIRALATNRGSIAGFRYAEAFMLLKDCL